MLQRSGTRMQWCELSIDYFSQSYIEVSLSYSDVDMIVKVLVFAYWLSLADRGPKLDAVPGAN